MYIYNLESEEGTRSVFSLSVYILSCVRLRKEVAEVEKERGNIQAHKAVAASMVVAPMVDRTGDRGISREIVPDRSSLRAIAPRLNISKIKTAS